MASGPSEEPGVSASDLDALVKDTGFFRSLVENGSDAIVSIDETSTIRYANASVERIFGYEPEEMIGEKLTMIMPDRFQADHFEAIDRYLHTGERNLDWNNIELPAKHKEGHEVPLSITFEEHSHEGDRLFSGIMRDISDRIERERELERQNERLERFASIVSHDLRDPLQAAHATLAVARAGEREADEQALAELAEILDRMDALIEDVLTLAKQGQAVGETEPVELAELARTAWSTAGDPDATLSLADELPTVPADPERLRALLENLFRNAVQHGVADDPGERSDSAAGGLTVTVGALDGGDGFYVADDGVGFGDTDPETLFEYGYTTDASGTGFGLSIVEDIANAHGWEVSATTGETGEAGARFEVRTR